MMLVLFFKEGDIMFHGSLVALITPMNVDKTIDFANLERLIEWHIQEGTDGLVILGSTGEFATILSKEREQIIRYILQRVRGRCPVIVGAGHNNTQIAIELTREAMELGADAALIVRSEEH